MHDQNIVPRPISTNLVQSAADRHGPNIIYDSEGLVGPGGQSYFADSQQGHKFRQLQQGGAYNFTGIETLTFQETITTIVDQDGNDLSSYLVGQVLTPPSGLIYTIVVNGIAYNLEETAGLACYRSTAGAIATINLNGSSESSFHVPTNQVPSVANAEGYRKWEDQTYNDIAHTGTASSTTDLVTPSGMLIEGGKYKLSYEITVNNTDTNLEIRVGAATGNLAGTTATNATIGVHEINFNIPSDLTSYTSITEDYIRIFRAASANAGFTMINIKLERTQVIPLDQSNPKGDADVEGNTIPLNYRGPAQLPVQIKDSSVSNFDGNLGATIANNSAYFSSNFEFSIIFITNPAGAKFRHLFSIGNFKIGLKTTDGVSSGGTLVLYTNSEGEIKKSFGGINEGVLYNLFVRVTNNGQTIYSILNGVEDTSSAALANITDDGGNVYIGQRSISFEKFLGNIFYWEFTTLDAIGNTIGQVIRFNYIDRNGLVNHNSALNRPNNSNAHISLNGSAAGSQWSTSNFQFPFALAEGFQLYQKSGSGDILVPLGVTVDPSIPADGYTKTGDIIGSGKRLLPFTGNTYDRNFDDVYELDSLNIKQNENKTTEDFRADRTTFNDSREDNRTSKLLAYNEFPEPHAGSGGKLDGLITAQSNIPKTDTDFIHGTGRFRLFILASFIDNTSTTDVKFLCGTTSSVATPAYGFRIEYGNRVAGFEGQIMLFYGFNSTTRIQSSDVSATLEDGNLHLIEFRAVIDNVQIYIDDNLVYELGSTLPGVSPTTSDDQLWISKGATAAQNHRGQIALLAIYDQYQNEPVFFPFQEDSALRWYNVGLQKTANTWAVISLNGAANNTQFQPNANVQYLHNYLYGSTYGGYFDGTIAGKFSEPTNTDTNWHIQGFKIETIIVCEVEISSDVIFSNGKYTAATQYGFQIAREQSTDKLAVIINGQVLLSTNSFELNVGKEITVKKKPTSAIVTVIIDGVSENLTFSGATINYDVTANSVTCGVRYNYDTPTYDLNFNGVIKKLRLTEIDDSEVETKELINNDWRSNDGTTVPNVGAQKPTSSDMTWIGGTGQTGIIPGDRSGSEKDVQQNDIEDPDKRRKYLLIDNYLRREEYIQL